MATFNSMPINTAVPQTGLIGAEQALQGGLAGALSGLTQGINTGRQDLQQFAGAGRNANQLQAALSGASGQQAQADAFSNFQSSPGQQYLRDQAEKSLLRNSAAIGGLGGGNVRQALQQQATGLAAQDFQNQFDRLGQVSGQGLTAAGGQAGLAQAGGQGASNLAFNTGQSLAQGRTNAGNAIAGNIGGTTSALAGLINQQGQGLSDLFTGASGNLANILQSAGVTQGQSQSELAKLLANIAAGQGNQASGIGNIPGVQQTEGLLGGLGQLASGVGTAVGAFSDIRMKENIEKIGEIKGVNLYKWDWKEDVAQVPMGVIAQEVEKLHPEVVSTHESGMLQVDYALLHERLS